VKHFELCKAFTDCTLLALFVVVVVVAESREPFRDMSSHSSCWVCHSPSIAT